MPKRAAVRGGEGRNISSVGFLYPARGVDLIVHAYEASQSLCLGTGGHHDSVEDVGRSIRASHRRVAHCPGNNDRRLNIEHQVQEVSDLFDRIRSLGHNGPGASAI